MTIINPSILWPLYAIKTRNIKKEYDGMKLTVSYYKTEMLDIEKLQPFQGNLKDLSEANYKKLRKQILDNGFAEPFSVWENEGNVYILNGHQRHREIVKMKEEGINVPALPCNFIRCANRKEAKKMILALTSQYGNMTEDGLYEFLEESGIGFEEMRDCFNFPEINMDDFGAGYYGDDDKGNDDGFEMPDHESIETDIKLGDLFEIGPHRLLCGDSTDPDQVARLMNGEKAVLCNTDPPYGINFVKLSQSKGQSKGYNDIENDDFKAGEFQEFLEKSIKASLQHLTDNCAFYFWHPMLTQGYFAAAAADIIIHRQIIWVKPTFIFGRGDYHWRHELCFYGWVKGHRPNFYGERNQNTIWEFARENDKIHPTQKPVKIFEIPIQNHTLKGQIVYEPFTGSGSQYVAAHQLKRKCYGMEIDPKYCQVIIDRMIRLDDTLEIKKNGVPYQRESMAS